MLIIYRIGVLWRTCITSQLLYTLIMLTTHRSTHKQHACATQQRSKSIAHTSGRTQHAIIYCNCVRKHVPCVYVIDIMLPRTYEERLKRRFFTGVGLQTSGCQRVEGGGLTGWIFFPKYVSPQLILFSETCMFKALAFSNIGLVLKPICRNMYCSEFV